MAENAEQEIIEYLQDPTPEGQIPLMVQLMQHSHNETNAILNQQIQWKDEEIQRLKFELSLIRRHIMSLFKGPYMPMPDLVLDALFPNDELLEAFQEGRIRFGGEYE